MAVSEYASGTQSCSAATEHTLTANPETTDGAYQLMLDLNALTIGVTLHARIKEKTISGGTQRVVWFDDLVGVVGEAKIWVSPVIMLVHGWDMSITSSGTPSIPWSIRKA
jgi:hypothetical protein